MALRAPAAGRRGQWVLKLWWVAFRGGGLGQAVKRGAVLRAVHATGNISSPEVRPPRCIRHQLDEVSLLITVTAGLSATGAHRVACGVFPNRRILSGGMSLLVIRGPAGGVRGG